MPSLVVGAGIAEVGCRNMTYLSNHLAPYPSTLGVQQQLPLMSSIGNGFSVRGARSGPTIAGNTMRGCAPLPQMCTVVTLHKSANAESVG